MSNAPASPPSKPHPQAEREKAAKAARLASALRDNLKRRKGARISPDTPLDDDPG